MSFEQATLVPNEEELLDQEIARAQAELEVVSNRLQRLIQLRRLNEDTEAATQVLDKLASEVAAQKERQEQVFASIEVLRQRLAEMG
jgi:hypothetical protein